MQQLHAAKVSEVQLSQQVALLTAQVAALEQAAAQVAALEQAAAAQQRLEVVGQKVGRRIPPRPPPPPPPPQTLPAHPPPTPCPPPPLTNPSPRQRCCTAEHGGEPVAAGICRARQGLEAAGCAR